MSMWPSDFGSIDLQLHAQMLWENQYLFRWCMHNTSSMLDIRYNSTDSYMFTIEDL